MTRDIGCPLTYDSRHYIIFKKYMTCAVFTWPDANTRGSLGERESLCKPEPPRRPTGECTEHKAHTKLHPGPEWHIFHILTSEGIDDVIYRCYTVFKMASERLFI